MKSLLWGSAVAASCLFTMSNFATAQNGSYAPSLLPARMSAQAANYRTTRSSARPFVTWSAPLPTPSYTGYSEDDAASSSAPAASVHESDAHGDQIVHGSVDCGACDACQGCGNWFVGASSLLMKPDRANPYLFSHDRSNEAHQLTNTQDAEIQWGGGFDLRIGRYFNCGANA